MRYACLALSGVLLLCTGLDAQQSATPPAAAAALAPYNRRDAG